MLSGTHLKPKDNLDVHEIIRQRHYCLTEVNRATGSMAQRLQSSHWRKSGPPTAINSAPWPLTVDTCILTRAGRPECLV
jgi:hypothetical protein